MARPSKIPTSGRRRVRRCNRKWQKAAPRPNSKKERRAKKNEAKQRGKGPTQRPVAHPMAETESKQLLAELDLPEPPVATEPAVQGPWTMAEDCAESVGSEELEGESEEEHMGWCTKGRHPSRQACGEEKGGKGRRARIAPINLRVAQVTLAYEMRRKKKKKAKCEQDTIQQMEADGEDPEAIQEAKAAIERRKAREARLPKTYWLPNVQFPIDFSVQQHANESYASSLGIDYPIPKGGDPVTFALVFAPWDEERSEEEEDVCTSPVDHPGPIPLSPQHSSVSLQREASSDSVDTETSEDSGAESRFSKAVEPGVCGYRSGCGATEEELASGGSIGFVRVMRCFCGAYSTEAIDRPWARGSQLSQGFEVGVSTEQAPWGTPSPSASSAFSGFSSSSPPLTPAGSSHSMAWDTDDEEEEEEEEMVVLPFTDRLWNYQGQLAHG